MSGICRPMGYERIHLGVGYGANVGCKVQIEFIEALGSAKTKKAPISLN